MFAFTLAPTATHAPWRAAPDGWYGAGGAVLPFLNPALETFSFTSDLGTVFCVRERSRATPQGYEGVTPVTPVTVEVHARLAAAIRNWPLAWMMMEVRRGQEPGISITSSRDHASATLFLTDDGTCLHGHWDPARLYPQAAERGLDPAAAALFLATFSQPYSTTGVIAGLRCLTAGATATWHPGHRLVLNEPDAVPPLYPRALRPDADPVGAVGRILGDVLNRQIGPGGPAVAAQLSGGLDSALVAIHAQDLVPGLATYGGIIPGARGDLQGARRAAVAAAFGLRDHTVRCEDYPLFSTRGRRLRDGCMVPWEESYFELFDVLLRAAADDGAAVMLTGFGGDELLGIYWHEAGEEEAARGDAVTYRTDFLTRRCRTLAGDPEAVPQPAPAARVLRSARHAQANAAAQAMRHGLWLVHPLCAPELAEFCRTLPLEWRKDRRLSRAWLAARGCGPAVTHPADSETFEDLLTLSYRGEAGEHLRAVLEDSVLADMGLIEPRRLLADFEEWLAGRRAEDDIIPMHAALTLELTARALEGSPALRAAS